MIYLRHATWISEHEMVHCAAEERGRDCRGAVWNVPLRENDTNEQDKIQIKFQKALIWMHVTHTNAKQDARQKETSLMSSKEQDDEGQELLDGRNRTKGEKNRKIQNKPDRRRSKSITNDAYLSNQYQIDLAVLSSHSMATKMAVNAACLQKFIRDSDGACGCVCSKFGLQKPTSLAIFAKLNHSNQ